MPGSEATKVISVVFLFPCQNYGLLYEKREQMSDTGANRASLQFSFREFTSITQLGFLLVTELVTSVIRVTELIIFSYPY